MENEQKWMHSHIPLVTCTVDLSLAIILSQREVRYRIYASLLLQAQVVKIIAAFIAHGLHHLQQMAKFWLIF